MEDFYGKKFGKSIFFSAAGILLQFFFSTQKTFFFFLQRTKVEMYFKKEMMGFGIRIFI